MSANFALGQALQHPHSARAFRPDALSLEALSALLWASFDINPRATGTEDFVATALLNLVYVADFARMPDAKPEEGGFLAGADAGCIAQDVYLFCASAGLATVARGLIDRRLLAAALGLAKTERVALAQMVGYPAKA